MTFEARIRVVVVSFSFLFGVVLEGLGFILVFLFL